MFSEPSIMRVFPIVFFKLRLSYGFLPYVLLDLLGNAPMLSTKNPLLPNLVDKRTCKPFETFSMLARSIGLSFAESELAKTFPEVPSVSLSFLIPWKTSGKVEDFQMGRLPWSRKLITITVTSKTSVISSRAAGNAIQPHSTCVQTVEFHIVPDANSGAVQSALVP